MKTLTKTALMLILLLAFTITLSAQKSEMLFPKLTGPYLGQKPPGLKPEIFARGILPSSKYHTTPVFTPDGKEVYWKMQGRKTISMMKMENGVWSTPSEIKLSLKLNDFRDPCISPDGKKIFFLSIGKLPYQKEEKENIWFAERKSDGWGEPQPLGEEINSHELHWQVSVASNGNLYFTSRNSGIEDIYCSRYIKGEYQTPERLSGNINTDKMCETTPYIDPDEKYLIFFRWDFYQEGKKNLYISFRNKDGSWCTAKNIINNYGVSPQVSHDKKYLFYLGPENGVYWVSASIIENLLKEALKEDK